MTALAYLRERVATPKVVALWVFVAWMSFAHRWIVDASERWHAHFAAIPFLILLVLAFRLSDDLASLKQDRIDWPDRVLSSAANPDKFRRALIAVALSMMIAGHLAAISLTTIVVALIGIALPFASPAPWPLWRYGLLVAAVSHHVPAALACTAGLLVFDAVEDSKAPKALQVVGWAGVTVAFAAWSLFALAFEHNDALAAVLGAGSIGAAFQVARSRRGRTRRVSLLALLALMLAARLFSAP